MIPKLRQVKGGLAMVCLQAQFRGCITVPPRCYQMVNFKVVMTNFPTFLTFLSLSQARYLSQGQIQMQITMSALVLCSRLNIESRSSTRRTITSRDLSQAGLYRRSLMAGRI